MPGLDTGFTGDWVTLYAVAQILYFLSFATLGYFLILPIDWVESDEAARGVPPDDLPLMVMAYPVLHEDFATMHSTMISFGRLDYPRSRMRIIAIPNSDDHETIASLRRLQEEFSFLEIGVIPPTSDPRWAIVWASWFGNPNAYWYHQGSTAGVHDLPPKKTRQLVFLLYRLISEIGTDWVLDYIDADSMPPPDHFRYGAAGLRQYDVLQATNVSGNLLDSLAASLHSYDHMCWDGRLHPHMSARGSHPYYVLGKGLFYRASDLYALGGFNPWITIEDPEIGMRLWTHGRRLGIIAAPLIEEVPRTFYRGIIQRNRWVCGFFQSLASPLKQMGMPFWRRMQARINILPVLIHPVHIIGLPTGLYAAWLFLRGADPFPPWLVALSLTNIAFYVMSSLFFYRNAWRRTALVLDKTSLRLRYMLRINPINVFLYHLLWIVPICIGFAMFLTNHGKVWIRTRKYDADRRFAKAPPEWANRAMRAQTAETERKRQDAA
jgi:cellulose synthase/poly-beta-1,6-N-acetylglucosamine synthase-like glycosyltransferase